MSNRSRLSRSSSSVGYQLPEYETRLAAAAVVDAAIVCYELRTSVTVSDSARALLVEAVYQNPTLTERLFPPKVGVAQV